MKTNEELFRYSNAVQEGYSAPIAFAQAGRNPGETIIAYEGERLGWGEVEITGTGQYDGCHKTTASGSVGTGGKIYMAVYINKPFNASVSGGQITAKKCTTTPPANGNGIAARERAGFFAENKTIIIIVAAIALLVGAVMYFKK